MMPRKEELPGADPRTGYRVSNRIEPSHLRTRMPMGQPRGHSQNVFYQPMTAHGAWKQSADGRWRDRAILFGLWLLVLLVATAIGLRFLDETDPSVTAFTGEDAATTAGLRRPLIDRPLVMPDDLSGVSDAFDELLPEPAGGDGLAAAPTTALLQEQRLAPAALGEGPSPANSSRTNPAEPARSMDAMKARQAPALPGTETALPRTSAAQRMSAEVREPEAAAAASQALPAAPVRDALALQGAGSRSGAVLQKAAPVCSAAQQAMQLCNVTVH